MNISWQQPWYEFINFYDEQTLEIYVIPSYACRVNNKQQQLLDEVLTTFCTIARASIKIVTRQISSDVNALRALSLNETQVKIFAPNSLQPPPRNIFCVAEFRFWWKWTRFNNPVDKKRWWHWRWQWRLCFSYQAQQIDELCLTQGEGTRNIQEISRNIGACSVTSMKFWSGDELLSMLYV